MIGFGNSNVFSIIFSQALFAMPDKKNEVSGLMIMGLVRRYGISVGYGSCQ